jgi:hypothetical protein
MEQSIKPIRISPKDCILVDGIYQPVFFAYKIPALLIGTSEDGIQYVQVMMNLQSGFILKESAPKELHSVIEIHNNNLDD